MQTRLWLIMPSNSSYTFGWNLVKISTHFSLTASCFLLCLSCSAQPVEEGSPAAEVLQLTTMTYNIRHGAGADGQVNIKRIAEVILSAQPDLVAIQEVDRFVERTNRVDQLAQLEMYTGMYAHFGFADNYQGGDFGNVILSKIPIDSLVLHPLPGPPGETRVLMEARLQIPFGTDQIPVTFMSTHLETIVEPRREAAGMIRDLIPVTPDHLYVLGGDMNATPYAPTMDTLTTRLRNPAIDRTVFTHPADSPVRQIDYLLYTAPATWSVAGIFALSAPVSSDHLPLVTVFNFRP